MELARQQCCLWLPAARETARRGRERAAAGLLQPLQPLVRQTCRRRRHAADAASVGAGARRTFPLRWLAGCACGIPTGGLARALRVTICNARPLARSSCETAARGWPAGGAGARCPPWRLLEGRRRAAHQPAVHCVREHSVRPTHCKALVAGCGRGAGAGASPPRAQFERSE